MLCSEPAPSTALVIDLFPKSSGDDLHRGAAVLCASLGCLCAARELLQQTRDRLCGQLAEPLRTELDGLESTCSQLAAELDAFPPLHRILDLDIGSHAGQST